MKQVASRIGPIERIPPNELLNDELVSALQLIPDQSVVEEIKEWAKKSQTKAYHFYMNELNTYFNMVWKDQIYENEDIENVVLEQMGKRTNMIINQLLENKLIIEERTPLVPFDYGIDERYTKINSLKQQSQNIKSKINEINDNLSGVVEEEETFEMKAIYQKLYSEEKIKEAEEYVKKKREEQIERKKKLREQRKKQEEDLQKKQAQIKEHEEQLAKARREQILKKQREYHEKRDQEKSQREQRNTEYMRIKKQLNDKPPLYQKIYEGYSKRYESEEQEKLKRMHSERKHYMDHVDRHKLEKHEREYEELKQKREKQRQDRISMILQEDKSRLKFHSSYQLPPKEPDPKDVEKQRAKEKREKIKQYRAIVRQKFKPKVDDLKRKQLMSLIEEMQIGNRRVKKTKLPNGSIVIEQLKVGDAKMIGMEYLERVKEMAAKAKTQRKNSSDFGKVNLTQDQKKHINYLDELRKNRTKYERPSLSIANMKKLSYEEKVKRIMQESDKLTEANKQNQMMLKFGKFKTSEEILQCKQEIDQNYLDIVNMKLKLIMNEDPNNDADSQYQ